VVRLETNLKGVLARETLRAVGTGEWLDRQVNTLMPLEIVITTESLDALVALEGALLSRWLGLAVDHWMTMITGHAHATNH
jgi:hypothetical protein